MATTFPIRASLTANVTSCRAKKQQSTNLAPLSKRQIRFAEKNHKLVYAFLQERRYDPDEYYDLAVMGYLRAVERYFTHTYLRRFSFSTVAYRAMQQSIASWKRGENRRRQAEEAYCALYGRRETVCDAEPSEAYFFSELQKCGTPQQAAFALLRMQG